MMRSLPLLLLGLFWSVAPASAATPAGGWSRLSPPGALGEPMCGRLAAKGTLLAFGLGMARSTDGGKTWTDASRGLDRDKGYGRPENIVAAAATGTALLAVSQNSTVYRSTDDGATWSVVARFFENGRDSVALVAEPARVHLLLKGAHFDSVDDGLTWQKNPQPIPGTTLLARNGKLWTGGRSGVFAWSTDDGAHWQKSRSGLPKDYDVNALAEDGGHLYAATNGGQLFTSRDGGDTWREVKLADTIRPLITDLVFAGSTLYVQTDQGIYRSERRGPWPKIHSPVPCPLVSVDKDLYMTTDRVLRSSDRGTSWNVVGTGFGGDDTNRLVVSPNGGVIVAYSDPTRRAFVSSDGGRTFVPASPSNVVAAAVDDRTILLAATDRASKSSADGPGYLLRSDDAGGTWTRLPIPASATLTRVLPLAINGRSVLLAAEGILFSRDAGVNWTRAIQGLPSPNGGWLYFPTNLNGLFLGPSTLVAGSDGVFLTSREGEPWKAIGPPSPADRRLQEARAVSALVAAGGDVYLLAWRRLYRWDRGASGGTTPVWTDLTGGIPAVSPDSPLQLMTAHGRRVLIVAGGQNSAVLLSDDRGSSWRPIADGLPPNHVTVVAASDKGWLAGTAGAGLWQRP